MLESIYESDKLDFIDMKIKETKIKIPSYEITSESAYLNRRKLIQSVGLLSLGLVISITIANDAPSNPEVNHLCPLIK